MYVYLQGAPSTYDILSVNPNFYSYETLHNKENFVLLSGGIDSQALALFLRKNKINCTTVFADFEWNYYDKAYAEKIGIDKNIKIDLDYLYFEKKVHKFYFDTVQCTSPQLAIHLYIVDKILQEQKNEMCNILMPGTPLFEYVNAKDDLKNKKGTIGLRDTKPSFTELSYWRYKQKNNVKNFFPSFFTDFPIHEELNTIANNIYKFLNYYTKKTLLYTSIDLPIIQQDGGWSGFEEYKLYLKQQTKMSYDKQLRDPITLNKKVRYANR